MAARQPITNININVVGVTFQNDNGTSRHAIITTLMPLERLTLVREPRNAYDKNAIAVMSAKGQVGYISRTYAQTMAPMMDMGVRFTAIVTDAGVIDGVPYCKIRIDESVTITDEERSEIFYHEVNKG